MKCPFAETDIECANLDTAGMNQTHSCSGCEHYPDPLDKLIKAYNLEQMLNFLPKSLIIGKKSIFRMNEIYDLNLTKDGIDNWVIAYNNEKSGQTLFRVVRQSLHLASAEMLADLIGNGYVKELKKDIVIWNVNKTPEKFELNNNA